MSAHISDRITNISDELTRSNRKPNQQLMKKFFTAVLAATMAVGASAEGYQVNTFSAKQEGMGHVGVAMKLGAESQIFNPGALAFMKKTMEISGSMSAIKSDCTATVDGVDYKSDNKVSTPMNFSAAFKIYDNLYAGVTFYTPYGSSINWGKAWPGSVLNQSVDLKVFTVQPTISWRVLPNLSIGAGLMIGWGNVNLNKGLVSGASMDEFTRKLPQLQYEAAKLQWTIAKTQQALGGPDPGAAPVEPTIHGTNYGNLAPASVNLKGDSELALGVNVGILWDINEKWNVGASFRSKMNMHVKKGDAKVDYAGESAELLGETLDVLNYTNFDASMPCPYVLTFGASFKPIPRLEIAADIQLNGWKTYKELNIDFAELGKTYDQDLTKNYRNALTYHLGAQFAMTHRLDLRAGLMIDTNPCNLNYYNPETPGMTKIEPSVGLSFRPIKGLSIDVAFMYVHGCGQKNAKAPYENLLASTFNSGLATYNAGVALYNQTLQSYGLPLYQAANISAMPESQTFTADYKLHAIIPAIGISYSF